MIFIGAVIDSLQMVIILTDKLSHPCELGGSSDFIISFMSFSVAWKEFILMFVLYKNMAEYFHFLSVYILMQKIVKEISFFIKI